MIHFIQLLFYFPETETKIHYNGIKIWNFEPQVMGGRERMVIDSVYWKILKGRGSTFRCKPLSALDWPSAAAIEIRIVPSAIGLPYA